MNQLNEGLYAQGETTEKYFGKGRNNEQEKEQELGQEISQARLFDAGRFYSNIASPFGPDSL
jgi:hypothetical protein